MVNTALLKKIIDESGLKRSYIARSIGVSAFTFAKKVRGETEFKASEITELCRVLNIHQAPVREAIFFPQEVDSKSTPE